MIRSRKWTVEKTVLLVLTLFHFFAMPGNSSLAGTDTVGQKQGVPFSSENYSQVIIENGIPKLSINGKINNNIFGVYVYCTGLDPTTGTFLQEMKRIIDRTSKLHIPIMSFDVLWSDYDRSVAVPKNAKEAAERFHTHNLDALLDYAASKNIYVILQLLVHDHWGLPTWWKQYKNNAKSYQLIDATSHANRLYNQLQSPVASYQSTTHRELLQALFTRLVLRYKKHPAVVGWGINVGPTGENGYTPNGIEFLLNKRIPRIDFRHAMADYSDIAVAQFRRWLLLKYKYINILNAAWHTQYSNIENVPPPLPVKATLQETFEINGDPRVSMRDWQTFRHDALIDEWRFLANLVRSMDPGKVIMGKTSWYPTFKSVGTGKMLVTATAVNEQHIINMDKLDIGITSHDYAGNMLFSASRIDYADLVKFTRNYGTIRICNLENWSKTENHEIKIERSLAVKETIRKEGGYLWFVTALDSDLKHKPSWTWKEISELVLRSADNEQLKSVKVQSPPVVFFTDVRALMPHYFVENEDIRGSRFYRNIARVFFDGNNEDKYGFVSVDDLMNDRISPSTRLLIMADQRFLSREIENKLQYFILHGGTIMFIGSNGVFNSSFEKDTRTIKGLVPNLSEKKIQTLYSWGLQRDIRVPLITVSADGSRFTELSLNETPSNNYRLFRAALPESVELPAHGELHLSSLPSEYKNTAMPKGLDTVFPKKHSTAKGRQAISAHPGNFIQDFDRNRDGTVSFEEFNGPVEIFERMYVNKDKIITRKEARTSSERPTSVNSHRPIPNDDKDFIKDFDRNRDGEVSSGEFPGPVEVFNHFDIDKDGVVTQKEAEAGKH